MGRSERRCLRNMTSFRKEYKSSIMQVERMLKDIEGQRFESKGELYDINPLTTLLKCSIGVYRDLPAILKVGFEIGESLDEIDIIKGDTKIPAIGVLGLEHIEMNRGLGLVEEIGIAKYIGEKEGLYKGELGGTDMSNIVMSKGMMTVGYGILKSKESGIELLDEVYLSGLYAVSQEMYTLYREYISGESDDYVKCLAMWWVTLQSLEETPLIRAYKCLCNYVVKGLNEEYTVYKELKISGDLEEDIKKYAGEGYTYILELLKVKSVLKEEPEGSIRVGNVSIDISEEDECSYIERLMKVVNTERSMPEGVLSGEEEALLAICDTYQLLMLYNYTYHYGLKVLGDRLKEKKELETSLKKKSRKEQSKKEKEWKKKEENYRNEIKRKEKEIKTLKTKTSKAVELEEYKKKLEELEDKVRLLENKNEYAKERIKKLEEEREQKSKLQNQQISEEVEDEIVCGLEEYEHEGKTVEEKYEEIKDLKFLLVGGTDKLYRKVKSKYNNVVYIGSVGEVSDIIKSEVGVVVIKHVSHQLTNKVYSKYEGIKWCYMKTLQIDELTNLLYSQVEQVEQVEGV